MTGRGRGYETAGLKTKAGGLVSDSVGLDTETPGRGYETAGLNNGGWISSRLVSDSIGVEEETPRTTSVTGGGDLMWKRVRDSGPQQNGG